jgi:O-antigen/teichoic acid export membrane protein
MMPTLAREHANNPDTVRPWYYTSVRFIVLVSLPIAIGGTLLSGNLISIFGDEFLPASLAFALLIWDLPFAMYHSFCGNITTSIKREGSAARIYVSVGLLNVLLNAILVPHFGLVAACFATILTDVFGAALFYLLLRREFGSGLKFGKMLYLALAACIMGVVVFLMSTISWVLSIPAGGLIYLFLVWKLPALTESERQQLTNIARQITNRFYLAR